jgi:E1A/CREB-binding protein
MGNVLFICLVILMSLLNSHLLFVCIFQWVQCNKCKAWQHEICALFNRKCEGAKAEYTCAKCFLSEKDSGDIQALEPSTVLGAHELPRTKLSDHIEQRLSERLKQDRQHRASASGKVAEEVFIIHTNDIRNY